MTIAVAGPPYSANTAEQRQKNFDAMNMAAAQLYERGHIPFIGVNMALPVVMHATTADEYEAMMEISMAVLDKCDATLMIGMSKGLPVYYSIDEIS